MEPMAAIMLLKFNFAKVETCLTIRDVKQTRMDQNRTVQTRNRLDPLLTGSKTVLFGLRGHYRLG